MVKKSLLRIYRILLWVLGITAAILVIAALEIQFFVMPHINDYKDKIAAYATKASNQKVVIGNITADWQGLSPHFSVSNIDIYDAESRPAPGRCGRRGLRRAHSSRPFEVSTQGMPHDLRGQTRQRPRRATGTH